MCYNKKETMSFLGTVRKDQKDHDAISICCIIIHRLGARAARLTYSISHPRQHQ